MAAWTDERTGRAIELWQAGASAGAIAEAIGGTTRNAVIGKLNRAGLRRSDSERAITFADGGRLARLSRAAKKKSREAAHKRNLPPTPEALEAAQADIAAVLARIAAQPDVLRLTRQGAVASLIDLEEEHCRYIIGEPRRGWCAHDAVAGMSYCATHAARCYRPLDGRDRLFAFVMLMANRETVEA